MKTVGERRQPGWGCLWLHPQRKGGGEFSQWPLPSCRHDWEALWEKKHMALDMHLQEQSESCNLVTHCLLFPPCSLPNVCVGEATSS